MIDTIIRHALAAVVYICWASCWWCCRRCRWPSFRWPAFVLIALIPWLISLPIAFLPGHPALLPLGVVLDFLLTVYIVAVLSLLYKAIVLDPPEDEQAPEATAAEP